MSTPAASHAREHDALPRERQRLVAIGIEGGRTLRQAGEERRLRRRQHRRFDAEVDAARPLDAGGLIAVGGEVQIEREDLALAEPVLEPQRDDRFVELGAPAAASIGRRRRNSSSFATCCVIVEPPSTMAFGDVLLDRPQIATGSTP